MRYFSLVVIMPILIGCGNPQAGTERNRSDTENTPKAVQEAKPVQVAEPGNPAPEARAGSNRKEVSGPTKQKPISASPEPLADKEKITVITARELLNEFGKNRVAANAKYKSKKVRVIGAVDRIDVDAQDNPLVFLTTWRFSGFLNLPPAGLGIPRAEAPTTQALVVCRFSESDSNTIGKVKPAADVAIEGLCERFSLSGRFYHVFLSRCTLHDVTAEEIAHIKDEEGKQ